MEPSLRVSYEFVYCVNQLLSRAYGTYILLLKYIRILARGSKGATRGVL